MLSLLRGAAAHDTQPLSCTKQGCLLVRYRIVRYPTPSDSIVTSYSFPVPIDSKHPGRLGHLRSGRMIYEFVGMVDKDIASIAYRYKHLVRADIKNFYPGIYTHSIAWALHGKNNVRKRENFRNYQLLGNRLDRLFQRANDGCTNGVPIGPAVSDIVAEIIASAVDRILSKGVKESSIDCEIIRFKDDYRILVQSEEDGRRVIKELQASLKEFSLEINEAKTEIKTLPEGLFREWVSRYHLVHPKKRAKYSWKQFRELYLAVLRIDEDCPGTGVIDRFLADIVSKYGALKVTVGSFNLQRIISMLLMLANRRVKAFPKVLAIIESVLRSPFGSAHQTEIVEHLERYLQSLVLEEERNKYLICWISYFIVSNGLKKDLSISPKLSDPITRSVYNNRSVLFKNATEFKLFKGCVAAGKEVSMLEHLEVFYPPKTG
ncbi:RNA-directed DNA polymerase [Thioalkalivibrio sp. K90mix]|uniref:RNA-directed DNA polymerase n=1 Tax=Thioalkalivibrio sp. (strain K90mix) TaxID=396595 RepID=UPI000314F93B|nr:RNA-directed DNA polymerase [Thioalkalivibrio sp. K90mix]